jgi:hypothetical protein
MRLPLAFAAASPDRAHSISNEFAFKLRNAGEDTEDEPTIWSAGVHSLMNRDEVDAQRPKFL